MATIRLPAPLRPYAQGQSEVNVPEGTVEQALHNLLDRYPYLRPHLLTDEEKLRPYVNLFIGEDNVNDLQGLGTPLRAADRLLILPSIAGGSGERA